MDVINALIQTGILVILAFTLFKVSSQIKVQNKQVDILNKQVETQNKMLNAQLLRDRLDMYWKTYEPVTVDDIKEFTLLLDDYMDRKKYEESYQDDNDSIRRYISLLTLYEYLAFTYTLKTLELPDPLGKDWTEHWAKDLLHYKEFIDVHEYHKSYYHEFGSFIDVVINNKNKP